MKLVICLIIAAVCVSVIDAHLVDDLTPNLAIPIANPIRIPPRKYNKFQSRRPGVSQQQFTSQIATGQWLSLYSVLIGTPGAFGKAKHIWRVSGNTVNRTTTVSETTCQRRIVNFTLGSDRSGAVLLREVSPGQRFEAFYSQDPSKYFWWLICLTPGPTSGSCTSGFFDLVIKDTRTNLTGDLNLVGLPWDRIAADLRAIRGLTFDNPAVTYVWTGTECPNP
ncbi:uncharacterized protein LOC127855991 [Dreissena polymorpha]|nr:uncharacterized protein LOC127855991 [Dreissena polymorpha]